MYVLARKISRDIDSAEHDALLRYQRLANLAVVANSCATGAGVWWLHGSSVEGMYIATLYQCCYSMAGFVNASTHVRNFILGLSINVGSAILYWALQGKGGVGITVPLLSLLFLLVTAARFNTGAFLESIRIRQENKDLLDSRVRYLAAANHDLRQPLQALSLYMNVLSRDTADGPAAQTVRKAKDTCRTLEELFGNLLELSHYDTGRVVPQPIPIELSSIVRQLDNEFELRTRSKQLQWEVACPPDAWVHSDPQLLSRLLRNLLDNALRYTDRGKIALVVARTAEGFDLVVRDTGRGIDTSDQKRVFLDFVRLEQADARTERGMGLGLAIVRRIDQLLGLKLSLSSEPGSGTEFRIQLAELSASLRPALSIAASAQEEDAQSLNLKIWAVEDDENIRDALALQLTQWGCEVRFAKTQRDLERLNELVGRWPDAIFLDDQIDGEEVAVDLARWILSTQPQMPVLLMTATANENRLAVLNTLGLPLFRKPVREEQLFKALQDIRLRRSQTGLAANDWERAAQASYVI